MKTFRIYGCSDDLIETEGVTGADEFGAWGGGEVGVRKVLLLKADGWELEIHCVYSGFWAFAIGPGWNCPSDHDQMPPWEIRRTWGWECSYSELVEIDVPDSAVVVEVEKK